MKPEKNISLIVGISIPFLMIALVAGSIYLPGLFAPSPQFNLLYVTQDDFHCGQHYVVEQNRLTKREVKCPEHRTPGVARLFMHDVTRNVNREISFEDAQQFMLDPSAKSPDGFEVVYGRHDYGVFPFFFVHDQDYGTRYLKGHGVSKKLNLEFLGDGRYYHYRGFLGWIKEETR